MTINKNKVISEQILAEAVDWANLLEVGLDDSQQIQFEAWLAKDEMATEALAQYYALLSLAEQKAEDTGQVIAFNRKPKRSTLYAKWGALIAAGLAIAIILVPQIGRNDDQQAPIHLEATQSRVDNYELADTSRIWLDSKTEAIFEQTSSSRLMALKSGRVFLDVAHDKSKPFIIDSGDVQFVVKGTSFEIDKQENKVDLSVETGLVEIHYDDVVTAVGRGNIASFDLKDRRLELAPIDESKIALWRENKLYFDNVSLSEVVDEFNRYFEAGIILNDPDLGAEKVSGVYEITGPDAFSDTLAELFSLDVHKNTLGEVEISRTEATDK